MITCKKLCNFSFSWVVLSSPATVPFLVLVWMILWGEGIESIYLSIIYLYIIFQFTEPLILISWLPLTYQPLPTAMLTLNYLETLSNIQETVAQNHPQHVVFREAERTAPGTPSDLTS